MASFDVESKVDPTEVRNGVENAMREIGTRYDFKGSKSEISFKEKESEIEILADDEMRRRACEEILMQKLAKRGVGLKALVVEPGEKAAGDMIRQAVKVKNGLDAEELKKMNKFIKSQKVKVSSQSQGDQLRVSGKKRDDLQNIMTALKKEFSGLELQFTNFRD